VEEKEFDALGDMLASAQWAFPAAQEYKNELVQPSFLGVAAVPKADSQAIVQTPPKFDPEAPASDEQWRKLNKMVV
jgi:hypothetical protein